MKRFAVFPNADQALARMSTVVLVGVLGACSGVPGRHFIDAAPPASSRGDLFLIRSADPLFADRDFSVLVDGLPAGALGNGSFLWLRLSPGGHLLVVRPVDGGRAIPQAVQVTPGTRQFFRYEFATGALARSDLVGAQIREIPEADARDLINWPEPRRVKDRPAGAAGVAGAVGPAISSASGPLEVGSDVAVDDIDAVPGLDARGRLQYQAWLRRPSPRAVVLARDGSVHWISGPRRADERPGGVAERALRVCQGGRHEGCRLYAVDHQVVWRD